MQNLPQTLHSVFENSSKIRERTTFAEGRGQGRTIPSTIDAVFVDVVSWLMNEVTERTISREQLLTKFAQWINNLWQTRPRCRVVVLLSERPRFIPPWRHTEESRNVSENCDKVPEDPLPYMWDDQNLGGIQGINAWLCKSQGRMECMRTLLSDLLNNSREPALHKLLVPFDDRPLLVDCDLPYGTFVVEKRTPGSRPWKDISVPGSTGETFLGLKRYLEEIERLSIEGTYGIRSYELISDSPEWGLMAIHLSYLLQGETFEGSVFTRKTPKLGWNQMARIWLQDRKGFWFSADGWYTLFKTAYANFYEPWSHFLALILLHENPLLGGTLFSTLDFSTLWHSLSQWNVLRNDSILDPDSFEKIHNGAFVFIHPATHTILFKANAFRSFVHFLHVRSDKALKDGEVSSLDRDLKGLFKKSMEDERAKVIAKLETNYWKIVLLAHARDAIPLPLLKLGLAQRDGLARRIVNLYIEHPREWKNFKSLDDLCNALNIEGTTGAQLIQKYQTEVYSKLKTKKLEDILKGRDLATLTLNLNQGLPDGESDMFAIRLYILENYAKHFMYDPEKATDRLSNAWRNMIWHLIYRTVGDTPLFAETSWYGPPNIWGWDSGIGIPLEVPVIRVLETAYVEIDKKRSTDPSSDEDFYKWTVLFTDKVVPHLFTKKANFGDHTIKNAKMTGSTTLSEADKYLEYGNPLEKSPIYGTHSLAIEAHIPRDLWNAYMFKLIPAQISVKKSTRTHLEGAISFPIAKTFNPLLQWLIAKPTAVLAANEIIKETMAMVEKILSRIKTPLGIPYYAETWLRELLDRCWSFSFFKVKKGVAQIEKLNGFFSKLLNGKTFGLLASKGAFGLLLDHVFERLMVDSRTIFGGLSFGKIVMFSTKGAWNLPLRKLKYGLNSVKPVPVGDDKWGHNIKGGPLGKPKNFLKNHTSIKQIQVDLSFYEVIQVTPDPPRVDFSNVEHLEALLELFRFCIMERYPKWSKPFNTLALESQWALQENTSNTDISWISTPFFEFGLGNIGEPFRQLYLGTLKNDGVGNELLLPEHYILNKNLIKKQIAFTLEAQRKESAVKLGSSFFYGFAAGPPKSSKITLSIDGGKDYPPMPGLVYAHSTMGVWGFLFHSTVWTNTKKCNSLLQNLGLRLTELKAYRYANLTTAKLEWSS